MTDQELLDQFAIAAMGSKQVLWSGNDAEFAGRCWSVAIAMKLARDRIFSTAMAAEMDPGPFPTIDLGLVEGLKP